MICLDLGAGQVSPEGFTPMGNAHGSAIYPLGVADASVDVIRASHVLEHFGHREVPSVIADWARALKPGGVLRLAVPDFAKIAQNYQAGVAQPTEAFLMGGQVDEADFHKALFDEASLKRLLAGAGLMLVRRWVSDIADCASLDISLNLEATKPHQSEIGVAAVMSLPRLGFMDNMFCALEALPPLKVSLRRCIGAYWGQCLERTLEDALTEDHPDALLTLDYDSVFTRRDVATLMQLMCCHPEADAIAAVQAGRGSIAGRLFTIKGPDGAGMTGVPMETFAGDLGKVSTAHFGLTLIRAAALVDLPKPWFVDVPSPEHNDWRGGHVDADINFWRKWEAAGKSLYLANRVPIGHLELSVLWPAALGDTTTPVMQPITDYRERGKPDTAWR